MCFQQKPDRRPPQITGRKVSAVHQGGVGAPNELATFRVTTLSLISSNEVCGEHEITPRLIPDLLENFSSRYWPRSPRETVFFRNSGKLKEKKNRPIGDRSGIFWLGSSGTSKFWPSIVIGLTIVSFFRVSPVSSIFLSDLIWHAVSRVLTVFSPVLCTTLWLCFTCFV